MTDLNNTKVTQDSCCCQPKKLIKREEVRIGADQALSLKSPIKSDQAQSSLFFIKSILLYNSTLVMVVCNINTKIIPFYPSMFFHLYDYEL